MHEGVCRLIVGQRNPVCTFCTCEGSFQIVGTKKWTCNPCAHTILAAATEPCWRDCDDTCGAHCSYSI